MKVIKKYFFLIVSIVTIITSCQSGDKKQSLFTKDQIDKLNLKSAKLLNIETDSLTKVNLNPFLKKESFKFDSLISEIKFIPLETSEKSLLDDIMKVIVTDSCIYIYDDYKAGGVVIFNKKGKFIKRIDNGKGPGELFRLYDIDFDNTNDQLIAYQHPYLTFYTSLGKFTKQKKLPLGAYNFLTIPKGYIFKTLDNQGNNHLGDLQNYTLLITDKNFKLKSVGMPKPENNLNYGGYNYLYNNISLSITERFSDTIYNYEKSLNKLKANYVLDYNTKKLPEQFTKNGFKKFEKAIKNNDYYFYLGEYLETNSCQTFFLENWYKGVKTAIYRDKSSGKLLGGTNFLFSPNEIPSIGFPRWTSGEYFVSLYFPNEKDLFISKSTLISDEDKLKLKNLTGNSNPVLVLFKLNSF
ncbi:6-bladed beta-propeller [Algibacter pacificus]|uniref:6-bladed beta-propeller n=1 Tax=Algibacter pacificus TaxID=2599389 RepID=UPI0011C96CEF|nr:6-bladed beta-propeller [Algibacter pacificus]